MRYWWVNQNQTFRQETRGNFMWSPKANANGTRNPFYDFMQTVAAGDIVFSYCDTQIKTVGIVTGPAQTAPKPDFGNAGVNWANEGWFVPVYYVHLETPLRPADHMVVLAPLLPARYAPLQPNGRGNRGVYLTELPSALAEALVALVGYAQFEEALALLTGFPDTPDPEEPDDAPPDLASTVRDQIIKARRGQGIFRSNVLLTEMACRVTGVRDPKHLRASHIKPWKHSTNAERLSGFNGLLLSPHVDHLFDKGYIGFSTTSTLLTVPDVRGTLLDAWGIDEGVHVGDFSRDQQAFLDYHRANVFNRASRSRALD
jgi:hypothetical protein